MDQKGSINDEKIIVTIDVDLEDIVPGYIENNRENIKTIEEAINKKDFEAIEMIGHNMNGSGAEYGFDGISEIGGKIEAAAKDSNSDEIKKQIEKLSSYLDRVEVVYE